MKKLEYIHLYTQNAHWGELNCISLLILMIYGKFYIKITFLNSGTTSVKDTPHVRVPQFVVLYKIFFWTKTPILFHFLHRKNFKIFFRLEMI